MIIVCLVVEAREDSNNVVQSNGQVHMSSNLKYSDPYRLYTAGANRFGRTPEADEVVLKPQAEIFENASTH